MAAIEITDRQRRAIAALLCSRNTQSAAQQAHVGARTLYRWLADPTFRAALVEAEGNAIDEATRHLLGLQERAISTFAEILEDRFTKQPVRMRAAQSVLDYLLRLRELRNLELRLAKLEKVIYEQDHPSPAG